MDDLALSRAPAMGFVAEGIYWGAFAALAPVLKDQIGASDGAFGLALLLASFGACAAMLLAPLVDRRFGRTAMLWPALAMATAFLLPGLAGGVAFFAIAMLFSAMGSGTLDVVMNARLSQIEAEAGRPLMNLNHAIFSFAYAASAMAAGLGREAGLSPFAIFALLGLVTLGLCLFIRQRKIRAPATGDAPGGARAPTALIVAGGAVILVAFMAEQATEGWSALHLERGLGGGAAQGALGPAILGLTMGIGRFSGQMLLGHLSEAMVIRWAALMAAVGAVVAAIAGSLAMAYAGFAILGLGVSVVAPLAFALVGRAVSDEVRTAAISRISVIGYMGFFIGPPMMGFLSEAYGLTASFLAIGGVLVLLAGPLAAVLIAQARIAAPSRAARHSQSPENPRGT